jgi:FAD/FMN-containing dehydrogenase
LKVVTLEQMPLEVHAEDQYANLPAEMTLAAFNASLPSDLHFRAPNLEMSVGDWVLSGGFGLLEAAPVRKDVLGLAYRTTEGLIEVGGRVVKNVSGYDLVRLIVGSDPALTHAIRLERLTLRLRPKPVIAEREVERPEDQLAFTFAELAALGAVYGIAHRFSDAEPWRVRGVWYGAAKGWGTSITTPIPADALLHDAHGAFPRAVPARSNLEQQILAAL